MFQTPGGKVAKPTFCGPAAAGPGKTRPGKTAPAHLTGAPRRAPIGWAGDLTSRAFSDSAHLVGLRPLRALRYLELDPLVLLQRPVAVRLDGREVDEHVLPAAVDGDETESLLSVEPLDGALCHVLLP